MSEFASCWALLAGSLLIAAPLILTRIRDHVTIEEVSTDNPKPDPRLTIQLQDLQFSDETYNEVAPTKETSDSQSE